MALGGDDDDPKTWEYERWLVGEARGRRIRATWSAGSPESAASRFVAVMVIAALSALLR